MIYGADQLLRKVRRLIVTQGGTVAVDATPVDFRGRIYPPGRPAQPAADDAAPRSYEARFVLWTRPAAYEALPGKLNPGDRVMSADGREFEVVGQGHGRRAGLTVMVYEHQLIPVEALYPQTATLQELGGAPVASVPVAIWQNTETAAGRGMYADWNGEAPAEHYAALQVTNRQLQVADTVLRVATAALSVGQPHVRMTLRSGA